MTTWTRWTSATRRRGSATSTATCWRTTATSTTTETASADELDPDDDGDGFGDPPATSHEGPANTDPTVDNCPGLANPAQLNIDGNFVDTTPPLTQNDTSRAMSDALGDVCDPDDDSDGVADLTEVALPGAACPSATAALDPFNTDTDGDGAMDGAECAIGTNPNNPSSVPAGVNRPTADQCRILAGAPLVSTDTDGDRILDRIEACGYGSSVSLVESDGDGVNDGCEAGSLNTLTVVNSGDQLLLSQAIVADLSGPFVWNADLNKDGGEQFGRPAVDWTAAEAIVVLGPRRRRPCWARFRLDVQ